MRLLFILFLLVSVRSQLDVDFALNDPKTINQQTSLQMQVFLFTGFQSGTITLNMQSPGSFTSNSNQRANCVSSEVTVDSCSINRSANTVTIDFTVGASTVQIIVFTIDTFENPSSTTDITNIQVDYVNTGGTINTSGSASIDDLEPDTLDSAPTITGAGIIGDIGQTITVSFDNKNDIPSNGMIQLIFPEYTSENQFVQVSNPACADVSGMPSSPSCTFDSSSLILELTSFSTSSISSGTTISFTVGSVRNPYSAKTKYGFTLYTLDQDGGYIDTYSSTSVDFGFSVTTIASFESASLGRRFSVTEVGSLTEGFPIFGLDFPIDPDCKLVLEFPTDMPVTSDLTTAEGFGIFSPLTNLDADTVTNTVTVEGCIFSSPKDPSSGGVFGAVYMSHMLNKGYVEETGSFTLTIYAVDGGIDYDIAQITGLTFNDFTPAPFQTFSVLPVTTYNVQESTTYEITLLPTNDIPGSNELVIQFPAEIVLIDGACGTTATGGTTVNPATCNVASNVITLTDVFGGSDYLVSSGEFSFIVYNSADTSQLGTNPTSSNPSFGDFQVNSYYVDGTSTLEIDEQITSTMFTPVATELNTAVTTDSFTTCSSGTTYTLTITPDKDVPSDGLLYIMFPDQILLSSSTFSSCSASYSAGGSRTLSCATSDKFPVTLTLSNVFASFSSGSIDISLDGLTNPSTMATSDSFTIATQDSDGYDIEIIEANLAITMTTISEMTLLEIEPDNYTTGVDTIYTITGISPCRLSNPTLLTFTIPSVITVTDLECEPVRSIRTISCSESGNILEATITFQSSTLASGASFQFTMQTMTNPPSTEPAGPYLDVYLTDANNFQINQYTTDLYTTMTEAAWATNYQLSQSNSALQEDATFTVSYTNYNAMPEGSTFMITYPEDIVPDSSLTICRAKIGGTTYPMSCEVSPSIKTIAFLGDNISREVAEGTEIELSFGPVTNPETNLYTVPSLTVTSYSDQEQLYAIDIVPIGLEPVMDCDYPCKTCATGNDASCVTCFLTDINNYLYLYEDSCLQRCPNGYYADSQRVCQACDEECKTCDQAGTCLTCSDEFPNFYQDFCYSSCLNGTYESENVCLDCNSNCATCTVSSTNCTSCDTSNLEQAFLSSGVCTNQCPEGTVDINYQCLDCNSPCKSCIIDQDTCTVCESGMFLYGFLCIDSCPNGTVVTDSTRCAGCDPNCDICSASDTNLCTQCQSDFILYENTCYKACPSGYEPDSEGIQCQIIQSGSGSGTGSRTNNDKVYAYFPFTITQIIMTGLSIGSYLKEPATLPLSMMLGMWGPVEFLALGGQTYLAYQKQVVDADTTVTTDTTDTNETTNVSEDVSSNSTQDASRRLSFRFLQDTSETEDTSEDTPVVSDTGTTFPLVFYASAISFLMLILTNVTYGILHCIIVRRDPGYLEHRRRFPCTERFIMVLGSVFSFKVSRFTFCNTLALDRFYVPFVDQKKVHNIFNALGILNALLTFMPVVCADVYGLIKYTWGDQFYVIIIETLLLAFSASILMFIEIRSSKLKRNYGEADSMSGLTNLTAEGLMDELRKRVGKMGLDDFLKMMSAEKGPTEPGGRKRRCNSMGDLGREVMGEDERRVHTDPLDPEELKYYESQPNPFVKNDYLDNVIAEPYKKARPKMDPSKLRVIATQTGERDKFTVNGKKLYEKETNESNDLDRRKNKNMKMRGRRDKYYEQVDDEDQNFADDTMGSMVQENEHMGDELDEERLGKIEEEESQHDEEEKTVTQDKTKGKDSLRGSKEKKTNASKGDLKKEGEQAKSPDQKKANEQEKGTEKKTGIEEKKIQEEKNQNEAFDEKEKTAEQKGISKDANQIEEGFFEFEDAGPGDNSGAPGEKKKKDANKSQQEQDKLEESIMGQHDLDQSQPEHKANQSIDSMREMENQILQQQPSQKSLAKEEEGEVDSDDDEEQRLLNMRNPDKRKFNVNDILGELDRDEKGNLVMLENKDGLTVDKSGNQVNDKGYLIDSKTGDVVEKEKKRKLFGKEELDEKGEIPPPFNLEKYNFNPHDVRGHFDKDSKGAEIIKKNEKGEMRDKLGRLVNEHGYLVDQQGNIVDKRGRVRLHEKQTEGGNMPLLFNYKGKKFDIKDVIGDFEKDRKGNVIIRRDKNNNMVDKQGRPVNNKGYLVDAQGNVINKDGKLMFEQFTLSKDNEIPKLFPFLKFNVDDVKGDFEMDPLGNPMLSKNKEGQLVDHRGRIVNEKGYLLDQEGNVKNQKGQKVFGKRLMEKDGDIPKVFRTGLFRKDSVDSFSQLMSEIEDLEKQQELKSEEKKRTEAEMEENERIAQRIDQIVEEDNDDDEMLMKELEELAQAKNPSNSNHLRVRNPANEEEEDDDGGNTSFDSLMDETPSNYNVANQRFMEQEAMRQRVKASKGKGEIIKEDMDVESDDYDGNLKKRRIKKKKKKNNPPPPNDVPIDREVLMAKAYGALNQNQLDKIIHDKKKREAQIVSQLNKNMQKNASIQRLGSHQQKRPQGVGQATNSTHRIVMEQQTPQDKVKKNGYMQQTMTSFNHDKAPSMTGLHQQDKKLNQVPTEQSIKAKSKMGKRDYNLTHLTNSVSGFYRGDSASDHSKMRSIHNESNQAQHLPVRKGGASKKDSLPISRENAKDPLNDAELDKIYKTAKQFADISMLSDWEKDSLLSGDSGFSQYTGIIGNAVQNKKVRGLESIYLQRLEPAKGRQTAMTRKGAKGKTDEKAKFRLMHHRLHDEPDWHVNEPRDLMGSAISDQKKFVEKKFKEEFVSGGSGSARKNQAPQDGLNIFSGNRNQYTNKTAAIIK